MPEIQLSLREEDTRRIRFALASYTTTNQQTFEGSPLYADQPWDTPHEFSYNRVLSYIAAQRGRGEVATTQVDALYDEYTVAGNDAPLDAFLTRMTLPPANIDLESGLADEAGSALQVLIARKRAERFGGVWHLDLGRQPVALTTPSGRFACALLDALYQKRKADRHTAHTAIIHPEQFSGQQRDMRRVLTALLEDHLPLEILNIFFRERKGEMRLSSILFTDSSGRTTHVNGYADRE